MNSRRTLDTSVQAQAAILEQMHCSVIATDPDGLIVYWNRFAEKQFQWPASKAIGRPYAEVILPEEDHAGAADALAQVRANGHLEIEATLIRQDGSRFSGHTVSTTLRSPQGEIIGQIGVTTDVTEQRAVEHRLRASEERFRSLAASAPLMIWMTDSSGRVEYVNTRTTETTGLSTEMTGKENWLDAVHPEDRATTLEAYTAALAERRELRHEFRMHDVRTANYVWVLGTATPRSSESGRFTGFVGYGLDITERRREQEARAEGAAIAATLAQVGQELISSLNSSNFLDQLCALSAEHLQCDSSHTLLRRATDGVFELIAGTYDSADEREASIGLTVPDELMAGLVERLRDTEVSAVHTLPASIRKLHPELTETGRLCMALRQGDDLIGIQTVQRPEGTPFSDTQIAIARGIAQLASLALDHARLVDELERASRVKSDFVATMSHELRTPLHVILGYTDLLLTGEFGPLLAEQEDTARRIDRRSRELHDLITNTLDVSRLDSGRVRLHIEDISLTTLLAEVDMETQQQQDDAGLCLQIALDEPPLPCARTP